MAAKGRLARMLLRPVTVVTIAIIHNLALTRG